MTVPPSFGLGLMVSALLPSTLTGQVRENPASPHQGPLTLTEVVELALASHPAVGEALARSEAAAGALGQARATLLPALGLDASLTRYEEPMLVAPLHGFDPTMAPTFDRNLVRGNLTLSYSLFEGGARAARIDGAEAGSALALAGEAASRMDVAVEASAAYLDLLSNRELLNAARDHLQALESEEERVRQFLAVGKAAQVELLRVQAALSQAEATEISLESASELAQGRLARLMGVEAGEVAARGVLPVEVAFGAGRVLASAQEEARTRNPDLSRARQRLVSASAGVRAARAKWLPSVRLTGAYADFGSLEGRHTQEFQGGLSFSYPLFTGGGRQGEVERAVAEEKEASEALRLAELRVDDAVDEALAAVTEAGARRAALERGVEQAAEVARIEGLALEVGSGVQTDFLQAQAAFFQARAALAQARHGEVLARVRLARVSGNLTPDWFQENTEVVR